MVLDELMGLIRGVKSRISAKIEEIRQKNKDLEELNILTGGLNNMLTGYQEARAADKAAMNDSVFGSCRCMQMFRDGYLGDIDSRSSSADSDMSSAAGCASSKAGTTQSEINSKEGELRSLRGTLSSYEAQIPLLSAQNTEGE